VTATVCSGLISVTQQDQQLAKFLFDDAKLTLQSFTTGLIREHLTCDPPLVSQSQFRFTVEVLNQTVQTGRANEGWVPPFQTSRS
jgi:CCR4-NOT transcription complex subunit 1